MIVFILLILICLFLAYGVAYIILYIPTYLLLKAETLKRTRRILAVIGGLLIISFYVFISPTNNNNTAIIQSDQNKYILTLTGRRLLMVHDPISALLRKTYVDTLKLLIPRQSGVINGGEISTKEGYKVNGTLNINENRLKVDLYYINDDEKTRDPLSWNDNYQVQQKK